MCLQSQVALFCVRYLQLFRSRQSMLNKSIRFLASINRRFRVSHWVPRSLLELVRTRALQRLVANLPDRIYLENQILPRISEQPWKKILFVGCEPYTQRYGQLFASRPLEYWTTDIKPESAIWGETERHVICDVCILDQYFAKQSFDAVLLNGVFGFGVNEVSQMDKAIHAIHNVLTPCGLLLLGWNSDLMQDPNELDSIRSKYTHETSMGLPSRKTFVDVTHVFDMFTALPGNFTPNC